MQGHRRPYSRHRRLYLQLSMRLNSLCYRQDRKRCLRLLNGQVFTKLFLLVLVRICLEHRWLHSISHMTAHRSKRHMTRMLLRCRLDHMELIIMGKARSSS